MARRTKIAIKIIRYAAKHDELSIEGAAKACCEDVKKRGGAIADIADYEYFCDYVHLKRWAQHCKTNMTELIELCRNKPGKWMSAIKTLIQYN